MIWEVEWSGVLFYSTKGEFGTKEFEVKAEHIFPMNKGSQAYTEFETSGEVIEFLMENTNMLGFNRGLSHSHNSMNVFFSGTDMSEINENSEFHNYYLSLISNNKEEMCAKIAFRGKSSEKINRSISFKGNNGKDGKFNITETKEEDVVFIYNCNIIREAEELVDNPYQIRVAQIIADATKKEEERKAAFQAVGKQSSIQFERGEGNSFEDFERRYNWQELKEGTKAVQNYDDSSHSKEIEEFTTTIIALDAFAEGTIESNLAKVKRKFGASKTDKNETNVDLYVLQILENYQALYHQYYEDIEEESFMEVLEEVCDIFEEYAVSNWVADEIYCALNNLFEEYSEQELQLTETIKA